jgi:hypothetical protein
MIKLHYVISLNNGGVDYEKYNKVNKKFKHNEGKFAGDFHQPTTFG